MIALEWAAFGFMMFVVQIIWLLLRDDECSWGWYFIYALICFFELFGFGYAVAVAFS